MRVFILAGIFLVSSLIISCDKEHNNPYDRACPADLWTPSKLKADTNNNIISISWEESETHIDGFVLERSPDSLSWNPIKGGLIDKSARNFQDTIDFSNRKYYYRIYAIADKNTSGITYSHVVKISNAPDYLPNKGLFGWWPFTGNANDESGYGNHGTANGAILTVDRFGKSNCAYSFDGIKDYIRCLRAGPTGNPVITASFWLNTNQQTYGHIIGYGDDGVYKNDFRIDINQNASSCIAFGTYGSELAFSTIFNKTWDFYTVIYYGNTSGSALSSKIYKNGLLLTTVCYDHYIGIPNILNKIPITFGRYHGTAQNGFFNGLLDDIAMWNRALTESEITNIYNLSK